MSWAGSSHRRCGRGSARSCRASWPASCRYSCSPTRKPVPVGFVAGTVDLLYRDPGDGALVVADYKTDEVEGAALEERASSYASQGRAYVRAVQEALGLATPPRLELWFLHAGRSSASREGAGGGAPAPGCLSSVSSAQ